jgi:cephalosporin hydroxylase
MPSGDSMLPPVYHTPWWCEVGHFNQDQADKYAALCAEVRPRFAIETGFCTGRSAASVLHYASGALQKMISIDRDLDWKSSLGRRMRDLLSSAFPHFNLIEQPSQQVLTEHFLKQEFPSGIDWVTIDGDHSYDGCRFDLEAIAPFLNPGGVMVVDDYHSGPPNGGRILEVDRAVDEFLATRRDQFTGEAWNHLGKGFCVIRRLPVSAPSNALTGTGSDGRGKVFGIGLSKTGTTSLSAALQQLGFRTTHYPRSLAEIAGLDAATDTPVALWYPVLDRQWPGSKFIYTTRNLKSWLDSCDNHWRRAGPMDAFTRQIRIGIYQRTDFEAAAFQAVYEAHEQAVSEYFRQRPEDLLTLNICGGEGWEKLCGFLNRPIPPGEFPRTNVRRGAA